MPVGGPHGQRAHAPGSFGAEPPRPVFPVGGHGAPPHGGPPHGGPPHGALPHGGAPPHGGPLHAGPPHGGPPGRGSLLGGPPPQPSHRAHGGQSAPHPSHQHSQGGRPGPHFPPPPPHGHGAPAQHHPGGREPRAPLLSAPARQGDRPPLLPTAPAPAPLPAPAPAPASAPEPEDGVVCRVFLPNPALYEYAEDVVGRLEAAGVVAAAQLAEGLTFGGVLDVARAARARFVMTVDAVGAPSGKVMVTSLVPLSSGSTMQERELPLPSAVAMVRSEENNFRRKHGLARAVAQAPAPAPPGRGEGTTAASAEGPRPSRGWDAEASASRGGAASHGSHAHGHQHGASAGHAAPGPAWGGPAPYDPAIPAEFLVDAAPHGPPHGHHGGGPGFHAGRLAHPPRGAQPQAMSAPDDGGWGAPPPAAVSMSALSAIVGRRPSGPDPRTGHRY